jgi:hypothetical protein
MKRTVLLAILLCAGVRLAEASDFTIREPGVAADSLLRADARIRITTRQLDLVQEEGSVEVADRTGLLMRMDGGPNTVYVPWYDVADLEVSRGTMRATAIAAAGGLVAGVVIGALVSETPRISDDWDDPYAFDRPHDNSGTAIVVGAFSGAVVGALIGSGIEIERWDRVRWAPRLYGSRGGGTGFGLSLTVPLNGR